MRIVQDFQWTHAARQRLRRVLAEEGLTDEVSIKECLKAKADRAVFAGQWQGQNVVVKLMWSDNASRLVTTGTEELTASLPRMSSGPYRVPAPLLVRAEAGLIVMTRVPGAPLIEVLRQGDTADRARLIAGAGRWLASYTAERRRRAAFGADYWVHIRQEALAAFTRPQDRALAEAVQASLVQQRQRLGGVQITQARVHGDFRAHNLMVDHDIIWGVDLHSPAWWPLARDAAHFLVQLHAAKAPPADAPMQHGLAKTDIQSMLNSGLLEAEPPHLLRFFIGVALGARLLAVGGHRTHGPRARRMLERYASED